MITVSHRPVCLWCERTPRRRRRRRRRRQRRNQTSETLRLKMQKEAPTQSAAPQWAASQPAGPWWGTGSCRDREVELLQHCLPDQRPPSAFIHSDFCSLPLRHLRRSDLLARCVHVADHKVLGDLLHVLVVEEGVEAQLVCGSKGNTLAPVEDRDGGAICVQVIQARTSGSLPPPTGQSNVTQPSFGSSSWNLAF